MKLKINNKKFLRNIIICIVSLLIVAFILNITPGYKRDKYKNTTNLVVHNENVTEDLKNEVYISEKGVIYLSKEDVRDLFDKTIYYDKEYNQIITTSDTKVANIMMGENQITINNTKLDILGSILEKDNIIYIPISEMGLVYNIQVEYIKDTNIVVIDNLNKGIIKADIAEDVKLKFKPRALSKDVVELKKGDKVSCFYTTSKGWREVRTTSGITGYVKANVLANEYILRQDMERLVEAQKIFIDNDNIKIDNESIIVKDLYGRIETTDDDKVWGEISNKLLETQSNIVLENYRSRANLINDIVNNVIDNNIKGLIVDFSNVGTDIYSRFLIELTPRLRELGVTVCVKTQDNTLVNNLRSVVDYII